MLKNKNLSFIDWVKSFFKPNYTPKKGDMGVYSYVWACDTFYEEQRPFNCDIYVKIKVIETYDKMVEVEIIETKINSYASPDIIEIIKKNSPKYISINKINWVTYEKYL